MATFSLQDTYKISHGKKVEKFVVDHKVLIRLYQPIIGSVATSLYLTFDSENSLNKNSKNSFKISRLVTLLQIDISKFNKAINTLSAHGLITIQSSTKKQNDFRFELKKTKTADEFFNDKKLIEEFQIIVDEVYYQQVYHYFMGDNVEDDEYVDLVEVKCNKIISDEDFYNQLKTKYPVITNSIVFDDKIRNEINRVRNLFKLDYVELEFAIINSITYTNEQMILDLIKFNDFVSSAFGKKEDELDSVLKASKTYEDKKPYTYYMAMTGRTALFKSEQVVIDSLIEEFQISEGVFNVVLDYCCKYKKMKDPIRDPHGVNYIRKVLQSIALENLTTTVEVMNYFRNFSGKKESQEKEVEKPIEKENNENKNDDLYSELKELLGGKE